VYRYKFKIGATVVYVGSTARNYIPGFVGREAIVIALKGTPSRRLYKIDFINGRKGYEAFEENLALAREKEPDWRL